VSASICLAEALETPHLNPLPFTKGDRRNNTEHI